MDPLLVQCTNFINPDFIKATDHQLTEHSPTKPLFNYLPSHRPPPD